MRPPEPSNGYGDSALRDAARLADARHYQGKQGLLQLPEAVLKIIKPGVRQKAEENKKENPSEDSS